MATWQKPLSPRIYGNLEKGLANPLPTCMLGTDHENKVFFLLACWLLPFFSFCQVPNSKLLDIELFFTWQIVLRVGKSQDLPSRIWQTFGNAYLSNKQVPEK